MTSTAREKDFGVRFKDVVDVGRYTIHANERSDSIIPMSLLYEFYIRGIIGVQYDLSPAVRGLGREYSDFEV